MIQLRPQVTPRWYEFGKAIGIKREVLDNCASKCAPEECIVEILDHWLRNRVEKATWKDVAKALKMIGLEKLALQIEDVYKTGIIKLNVCCDNRNMDRNFLSAGKLPVEVDMNAVPNDLAFTSDSDAPPPIPPKALDLSDNGILHETPPHQRAVPPIPRRSAHAMPSFRMNK